MCGIAGFYGFTDNKLIKKISKELEHRGPDAEGFFINDHVTLLNRRLAIIDRKGGDQPIFNEDKSVVVTYNGEIYNYRELRNLLEIAGHKFQTNSDTEVIVHGYEEWGEICFDKFNGMFAAALYDKRQEKLILARDHFGIKPLYYSLIDRDSATQFLSSETIAFTSSFKLLFSSEIKPIINSGLIKKEPNDRIIYRYLKFRIHDDQRETFFKGIYKLLPGEYMIVQNSTLNQNKFGTGSPRTDPRSSTGVKLEIRRYTNLKDELTKFASVHPTGVQARKLSKKEIIDFKELLIEAVKMRLISEVPVGTCLSGGLDSSTIVSIVNKLLRKKVREAESVGKIQNTFSAVFPGGGNDEEKYIEILKTQISNINSLNIYPKPEEFFQELEDLVTTQEEPTISTGPYAQYKVMQAAQKRVTVLLDGQGADEMMAGYIPYYIVYLRQLWKERNWLTFLKEVIGSLDIIMNVSINQLIGTFSNINKVDVDRLLNEKLKLSYRTEKFMAEDFNLKKRLIEDIFSNSLPALLRYEDKNSMRFSMEGRVPFLDFNLLRFLFALPDEAIIKNGWNKYVLRQSGKDLIPDAIRLRRNKIGFTTPEKEWFIRLKNKIYSIFLSESFSHRKYFNQNEVLKAFQKFIEGKNDDTMVFWRMLNLEIWLRLFIDSKNVDALTSSRVKKQNTNSGKNLMIKVEGKEYLRYPIRTELFKRGDNVADKIAKAVSNYLVNKSMGVLDHLQDNSQIKVNASWFLVVSEKIVAISQGRSYFIGDIKTGFWANLLSKNVKRTPYGIGLGSPWTMQLAISEIGLARILIASLISLISKPFGISGLFYRIAGPEAAAIDGPTEYSLYPSNVSAKLGPKEPGKVAENIHNFLISNFKFQISNQFSKNKFKKLNNSKLNENLKIKIKNFLGVVIIDANDLGQKVLGNSTGLDNKLIEKIFSDNPMGQSDEQTPLVMVQF